MILAQENSSILYEMTQIIKLHYMMWKDFNPGTTQVKSECQKEVHNLTAASLLGESSKLHNMASE